MRDTGHHDLALYRQQLMQLEPGKRIALTSGMFDAAREMMRGRLRAQEPDLSEADVRVRLFEQTYGRDFSDDERARIVRALRRSHADP